MRVGRRLIQIAINRHKIIAPILLAMSGNTDHAQMVRLRKEACILSGISRRTLGRWLDGYQDSGFEGLKPAKRNVVSGFAIPEDLIQEAILLRREVPSRSVGQIIEILEMEGKAAPGLLKRTTLQDTLQERGYSARQIKLYQQQGVAARRFARIDRNDLWRVYFDNGKQYRTKWMERACAMLEIKLLYAKPYSPESTGKIERFNRTVESFLAEVELKRPQTLEEYNNYFKIWLQECY